MMKDYILITTDELMKLTENKLTKSACEELLDWVYTYEYKVDIIDDMILMEDAQQDIEFQVFTIKEFVEYWLYTLEMKYDFSENSFDREIYDTDLIEETKKLTMELKNI